MSHQLRIIIEGKNTQRLSYALDPSVSTVIGRGGKADILLKLQEVSGLHATLRYDWQQEHYFLDDLGSKQGTFIGSKRVEPGSPEPIAFEQKFQIGRAFIEIVSKPKPSAAVSDDKTLMFGGGLATMMSLSSELDPPPIPSPSPNAGPDKTMMSSDAEQANIAGISNRAADTAPIGIYKAIAAVAAAHNAASNEPNLSREVQEILLRRVDLADIVRETENDEHARVIVREQIGYVVNELLTKGRISKSQVEKVEKDAFDDILGFGPIQELIDRHDISEIMVNGPNQIYYEQSGKLHLATRDFQSEQHVLQILRRLLKNSQRRIDEATPMVNATLPDGSRLHAIIPPLALNGPTITIRKFHENLPLQRLVDFGALTSAMASFIELATSERQNIIVSGGAGSGKTTLLNCLSSFIPENQRVITIEDTAELSLVQPHVVRLQARPSNTEGVGLVSIQDLVVEALRMRPDRIIVGECRHAEALDMLQAMNTGHDGSLTTIHSNSAADALARLETMVLLSGLELPMSAIREQIRSAVNFIVHASRLIDGSRKVVEIIEITGMEEGQITTQPVYQFVQEGLDDESRVIGKHQPTGYIPGFLNTMRQQGKEIPPNLFAI